MDLLSKLKVATGIKTIFENIEEPKEEDIFELTAEEYQAFKRSPLADEADEKIYKWQPPNRSFECKEILILKKSQKWILMEAAMTIEDYANRTNRKFDTYCDKLRFVATLMPSVFSKGTQFEQKDTESTNNNPSLG